MKKKTFIIIAILLFSSSLVWVLLTPLLFPSTLLESQQTFAPHEGFLAPPFSLKTPQDYTISLSDYNGQPVLVFFWASWCSVCKRTMPVLQKLYDDYSPKGFKILAINTTYQDIPTTAVSQFQNQGYTFIMLLDMEGQTAKDYHLFALPTAFLVGPDGIIQEVSIGSGLSEGAISSRLENLFSINE